MATPEPPPRLRLAQLPTPLRPLSRLSRELPMRVWVKRDDMTAAGSGGNKLRKLEFALAAAQAQGCDTLITCGGLQSNHCRATALVGARLGMAVHLVLRGVPQPPYDGNLMLDRLAGARLSCYPPAQYNAELDELLAQWRQHYQDAGQRAFVIPTGGSDALGLWGYIEAAAELRADCARLGIRPAHIVCADGSGGTHGGLALGAALYGLEATVWGINVCEDAGWFERRIAELMHDWQRRYGAAARSASLPPIRMIDGYAAPGYGRASQAVWRTISRVARTEGLLLDPVYTGKAFHGMLAEIDAGRFGSVDGAGGAGDIVFVHTGGMPGLFPQREACAANSAGPQELEALA